MARGTPAARRAAAIDHPRGLFLEMENLLFNGREVVFDAMKAALKDKGVKLTPALFARYCIESCALYGVGEILASAGKARISKEKLAGQIRDRMREAFLDGEASWTPGALRLVEKATSRGCRVGLLTCLDDETAKEIVSRHGVDGRIAGVLSYACGGKSYPSADALVRLARQTNLPSSQCVMVCTCAFSCRSALSAGMRCVAVPDRFTGFQDFSGANRVVNALDDGSVKTIVSLLEN